MAGLALVFTIIGFVFALVAAIFGIIILIQAFKSDTTQGILCLCVPFYIIYWAFAKMQHEKKKMFIMGYLGGLGGYIVLYVIAMVFAGMAITGAAGDLQQMYGTGMPGMTAYPGGYPGMTAMPMTGWPMTAQ